jgi:hypothetical protein
VDASIKIRSRGREPSTASKRFRSVQMRFSISSPSAVRMQILVHADAKMLHGWPPLFAA